MATGALGARPLLVFESYEARLLNLPGHPDTPEAAMSSLVERGFQLPAPERWTFPEVRDHQLDIHEEFDPFALIDDAV